MPQGSGLLLCPPWAQAVFAETMATMGDPSPVALVFAQIPPEELQVALMDP